MLTFRLLSKRTGENTYYYVRPLLARQANPKGDEASRSCVTSGDWSAWPCVAGWCPAKAAPMGGATHL